MLTIKSFHSAPHSLVQSAIAATQPTLQASARTTRGEPSPTAIDAFRQTLQHATEILSTLPHPRLYRSRAKAFPAASASPLSATTPLSPVCLEIMLDYAWAAIRNNTSRMAELTNDFKTSGCDGVGWLSAAFDYLLTHNPVYTDTPPYVPAGCTLALPEQPTFRIGILGDWGTGEPVAQLVLDALFAQQPDLIIHVGDIYYAGTADEVQHNFLDLIERARKTAGHAIPFYNLDGNHDMYSGGAPFYNALPQLNAGATFRRSGNPAPIQTASFFTLSNSWLQLQAMDTGFFDSDLWDVGDDTTMLHPAEAQWHVTQMEQAAAVSRSVLLFSHHQPWSRFLAIGQGQGAVPDPEGTAATTRTCFNPNLQAALGSAPVGPVKAWFWGHEQVLEVYDQAAIAASTAPSAAGPDVPLASLFPWVPYGACIGHGAFPMLQTDDPYTVAAPTIASNPALQVTLSGNPPVFEHGFVTVDIAQAGGGPTTATYFALPGDGSIATPRLVGTSTLA